MIELVHQFFVALWQIVLELSPPLLGGLTLAGLIHLMLPPGFIHRTLSNRGLGSVFRSVLVGVPMPLCSCGVLPTALSLRKEGASNGATTAFLISTPQTGVDSILVNVSFFGWPFTLFKLVTAFFTGLVGGVIAEHAEKPSTIAEHHPGNFKQLPKTYAEFWRYTVIELYGAIDKWIYVGVLLAALISTLTPPNFFADMSFAQGFGGILTMLVIAVPLYVCATGSVPIAASLVAAGLPLGTAMVFLMAGPATNVATIGAVYRALGLRLLIVYLGTVVVMSIGSALLFESLIGGEINFTAHQHSTPYPGIASLAVLTGVSLWLQQYRYQQRKQHLTLIKESDMGITLVVEGMSCQHCVSSVKQSLEALEGVETASPDLDTGKVVINGNSLDITLLRQTITEAGYNVKD